MAVAGKGPVLTRDAPPALTAEAAILIDSVTGTVLYERYAHVRKYPASTTKTMTGLLCVEKGDLDGTVTISKRSAAVGESSLNLTEGQQIKLRHLLAGVLLKSANDAATAVAEAVGGDYATFIAMMNQRAAALGLSDTHFVNPHGLHSVDHYSSAHDLACIARAAMANEVFRGIVGKQHISIPWPGKPEGRQLDNLNRLLPRWSAVDGVKTGYTSQAGRCLVASATVDGWRLIAVCLKCEDSWRDCEALLRWGFDNYQLVKVIAAGTGPWECRVSGGAARAVPVAATDDLWLPLSRSLELPRPYADLPTTPAPVERGRTLGAVCVTSGGMNHRVPLAAVDSVDRCVWAVLEQSPRHLAAVLLLAALSFGVLVHGATAKVTRARRRGVPQREREAHLSRASVGEWQGGH